MEPTSAITGKVLSVSFLPASNQGTVVLPVVGGVEFSVDALTVECEECELGAFVEWLTTSPEVFARVIDGRAEFKLSAF